MKWILLLAVFVVACGEEPAKSMTPVVIDTSIVNNVNNTNNINNDDTKSDDTIVETNNSDDTVSGDRVGATCEECTTACLILDPWHDGYCTNVCDVDADCGEGAHCGLRSAGAKCLLSCETDADCTRENYRCYDRDFDGQNECAPIGLGASTFGGTCEENSDCAGNGGVCLMNFQGGFCSYMCREDSDCGAGAHCGWEDLCLVTCVEDSDCDRGHACIDADRDSVGECWDVSDNTLGEYCESNDDCNGGGCVTFSEGQAMCTYSCTDSLQCPQGECLAGACYRSCEVDSDCPEGNLCLADDRVEGKVCSYPSYN